MAEAPQKNSIDYDGLISEIIKAVVSRIKGDDGEMGKYDYLTKPDDKNIKTMSVLSESQLDSTAECNFLGSTFPTFSPLRNFTRELAQWSPSKQGKRADQLTAAMIKTETNVIPTVMQAPKPAVNKKEQKQQAKEAEK